MYQYNSQDNCDVQAGHLVAFMLISVLQNGQDLVVDGASLVGFLVMHVTLFINLTSMNTINAIMTKLITLVMNAP